MTDFLLYKNLETGIQIQLDRSKFMLETVDKIMNLMDSIEYGFKDENGNNIIHTNFQKWEEEFGKFYYLQTPEELTQSQCGVCWDQVELERKLFSENDITVKTYFIYLLDEDMLPSHTFLTFEKDGKHYWFEHSWRKYKGIHEYRKVEDLLKDVIDKFRNDHKEVKRNADLYLYEYQKPKDHISCDDFYKYIETQKLIEIKL